jgi:hypothetical protein
LLATAAALLAACAAAGLPLQGCFLDPEEEPAGADAAADTLPPAVCTGAEADCDEQPGNGCEVDTASNPDHCGACGQSCGQAGCVQGQCTEPPQLVAAGLQGPMRLRAHAGQLYFTTAGEWDPVAGVQLGSIGRAAVDGSGSAVLAKRQLGPDGLVVGGAHVWWTNAISGTVLRVPLEGGEPETLVSGLASPRALASDGQFLFWGSAADRTVMRAALDGSGVTTLGQDPNPVLSVETFEAWVVFGTSRGLATVPKQGGDASTVALGRHNVVDVFARDGALFWLAQGPAGAAGAGAVYETTGSQEREVAGAQGAPMSVTADELAIYWTNLTAGTVMKAARSGGAPTMLASHQAQPWGIVADEQWVYFSCFGSGELKKVAR